MRKFFLLVLVMLGLAAAVSLLAGQGSGYLLIAFGDTTIELTLVLAVGLAILGYFALNFLFSAIRLVLGTRRGISGWASNRRMQRGLSRTTQGLIAFVEGRWDVAHKSLAKAASTSSTPMINYLFAARASSELGDGKAVDDYLRHAAESTSDAGVAIGLTQAELQMSNGQYEQALATLLRTRKDSTNHPVVLRMLAEVYRQLADWESLIQLLPVLEKNKVLGTDKQEELELIACRELLERSARESSQKLVASWKGLPAKIKKDSQAVACYAKKLLSHSQCNEAESVLRQALNSHFDVQLCNLYGRAEAEQAQKQQAFVEKMLKTRPDSAELLLAMGRISLRNQANDVAIEYFEKSYALDPGVEVCSELAKLAAAGRDFEKSNRYYAEALAAIVGTGANPLAIGQQPPASPAEAFHSLDELGSLSV